MTSTVWALLALALGADSAGAHVEASVGAGAGYDSNLNHVAARRGEVGSGSGTALARLGLALSLGESTGIYAGGAYDGVFYPSYSDLGFNQLGADVVLSQEIGEGVALYLAPALSGSWYGDPARNSTTFGTRLTVRWRPMETLSLRAHYRYLDRSAAAAVFSSTSSRIGASAELKLGRRTWISAGFSSQWGDEVFYVPTSGTPMGRMSGTFGSNQQAVRAQATTQDLSAGLEQGLEGGLYLSLAYDLAFVSSTVASYSDSSLTGLVGYRF